MKFQDIKIERRICSYDLREILLLYHPACFPRRSGRRVALSETIVNDVLDDMPTLRRGDVEAFVSQWTNEIGYIRALARGGRRATIGGGKTKVTTQEQIKARQRLRWES